MTTSGSTDFTLTRDQIITTALRRLRVLDAGETAAAGDITTGAQVLNLMLKALALKDVTLWLTQEAELALILARGMYLLGPTGDPCLTVVGATQITRPVEVLEARIRDTDDNDEPLEVCATRDEFFSISDKTSSGDATHVWYDPITTNGRFYVWPVADDATKTIVLTMRRTIEDFDASTDDFDGPPEVLDALAWNLAVNLAPEYGREVPQLVMAKAQETFRDVERKYREKTSLRLHP
jgi:hypothetical protein